MSFDIIKINQIKELQTNLDAKLESISGLNISDLINNSNFIDASNITFENLNINGDIGIGATQAAQGNHNHNLNDLTEKSYDNLTNKPDLVRGILDNNLIEIDSTTIASGEYGKFTLNGLKSVSVNEIKTDLNYMASDIEIDQLGSPTYTTIQDWLNIIQSAGRISGGTISQHTDAITGVTTGGAGSGEFKISGDYTTIYIASLSISILDSTGNDGEYTVKVGGSSYSGGITTIPVDEAVSDSTIDGNVLNGRVDIEAGTGFIKILDEHAAETKPFNWNQQTNLELTGYSTNYIYISYNGGNPIAKATTDRSIISLHTEFPISITYRGNGTTYPFESGHNIIDFSRHNHERLIELYGFKRASGGNITAYATSGIQSDAGVAYRGLNRILTDAKNSTTHKITSVYYDGSNWIWTEDETTINLTHYNNIASGLVELSNPQKYAVHWICIDYNGNLFSIYGQDEYSLTEAQGVGIPSLMPVVASEFGVVAAKVIIKKNITTFEEIISAYTEEVTSATPAVHNDLSGKQGGTTDQYYHLTLAELNKLSGIEDSADVNNISDVNAVDLTDAGDTILHYHANDRDRANHTGSQAASTISDFDTEVSNNINVAANTAKITNATHTGDVTGSVDLTIGLNKVNDTHIDWGTGANQISADDIPDGSSNAIISLTQETNFDTAYAHSQVISGNPHSVSKTDLSLNNVENLKVKLDATSTPTVNNDIDEGYSVGSRWFDITNDKEYVCLDNTDGAAVWVETTQSGGSGAAKDTALIEISANQVTNLTVGSHIEFDTIEQFGLDISLATGAGQADGIITLASGKKWRITAALRTIYAANTGALTYKLYNRTDSQYIGSSGITITPTFTAHYGSQINAVAILDATAQAKDIDLRISTNDNCTTVAMADFSHCLIEEV